MPAIRMIHQQHGATHAYDSGEVERLKSYGWSLESEPVAVAPVETPEATESPVARKKPGPKPKAK